MEVLCPRCRVACAREETYTLFKVERHLCAGCGGVWYDRAELEALADDLKVALGSEFGPAADGSRTCPRCDNPMRVELAGGEQRVPLDVCREHGVWFDREELEPVLQHLQENASTARKLSWWEWPFVLLDHLGMMNLARHRGLIGSPGPPREE